MTATTTAPRAEKTLRLTGRFATPDAWARAAGMIAASVASAGAGAGCQPTEADPLSVRVYNDGGALLAAALIWLDLVEGYSVYPATEGPGVDALHISGNGFLLAADELCAPETCQIDGPLWEVLTGSHAALGH